MYLLLRRDFHLVTLDHKDLMGAASLRLWCLYRVLRLSGQDDKNNQKVLKPKDLLFVWLRMMETSMYYGTFKADKKIFGTLL